MLNLFNALMPKEDKFFPLFSRHAATIVAAAQALQSLVNDGADRAESYRERISEHENEADQITREVLQAVRRSFITPFDRSDIQDLISSLDDAIDQMQKTAKVIGLFEVHEFGPAVREMAAIIVQAAQRTEEAVGLLGTMRQNVGRLHILTEQIIHLEDQSDHLYDEGRKTLFARHRHDDPMAFIIGVDILSHLEKVVDRFEDVANRINAIVIEQV